MNMEIKKSLHLDLSQNKYSNYIKINPYVTNGHKMNPDGQ